MIWLPRVLGSNRLDCQTSLLEIAMSTEVGAFEAKTKLPEILRRVAAGERFTITNRGRPVAEIVPPSQPGAATAGAAVARMKAFKRIKGVKAATVRELVEEGRR